jgi:hypothetical protein
MVPQNSFNDQRQRKTDACNRTASHEKRFEVTRADV